ncbi:hypothetical protein [Polymorphospora rubra]|uniref:hypothetical protein n=1 Tax=Polymorphospora rubra TaxID=338584 RepID=UPI0033D8636F
MIDDFAKDYPLGQLRSTRRALVWKLDGRPEYDVRRPLTATTARRAGHADILREQIDGRTGVMAEYEEQVDTAAREAHWAKIKRAAQEAASGSHHADLSDTHCAVGTEP